MCEIDYKVKVVSPCTPRKWGDAMEVVATVLASTPEGIVAMRKALGLTRDHRDWSDPASTRWANESRFRTREERWISPWVEYWRAEKAERWDMT